jgi:hypothetical protein
MLTTKFGPKDHKIRIFKTQGIPASKPKDKCPWTHLTGECLDYIRAASECSGMGIDPCKPLSSGITLKIASHTPSPKPGNGVVRKKKATNCSQIMRFFRDVNILAAARDLLERTVTCGVILHLSKHAIPHHQSKAMHCRTIIRTHPRQAALELVNGKLDDTPASHTCQGGLDAAQRACTKPSTAQI